MSTTNRLLIVIATYNEIENLPRLAGQLFSLINDMELVVVDDNSPDGTGRWCETESSDNERFHHIGREGKLGLGSATLEGLKFGRDRGFSFVATMDADFSHCPKSLAQMWEWTQELTSIDSNETFGATIGSRYVEGGSIVGWPWHRRMASKFVNRFARSTLGLPTLDNTGAFRIYKTESLVAADVFSINTRGFAYLEEILFLLNKEQFVLHEFPITFNDREKGKSKASVAEGLTILRNIWRLRKA
jgi:dolichol-phosphate mannosyltransferase